MKNVKLCIIILSSIWLWTCTRTVEKIIYPEGDPASTGAVVGVVIPKNCQAKIIVRQASALDSLLIDPLTGQFRFNNLPVGNYDLTIKAPNYGLKWLRSVLIYAGGVTYVGEISLSRVPEQILALYPEDQSEIVYDRRWSQISIAIKFEKSMDRKSVEEAFSTNPPSVGTFYWGTFAETPTPRYFWDEKRYTWDESGGNSNPGATITTYSKVKAFTYRMARKDGYTDTTYTVTLSTVAQDTAGRHLEFPLQFSFRTVQSATTQDAILTNPENGDIYVDPLENTSILVSFPCRMNQASVETGLRLLPSTNAIFVWSEGYKLKIYTGGPLFCSTLYQLQLPETVLDLDGVPLGEAFACSFETAPVRIEGTNPQAGEIFVLRNARLSIIFNTYMILSSVQSALSITPPINGTLIRGYAHSNGSPKDLMTLIPVNALATNTKYTVTIGTGACDLHGTHLPEPYTFMFVTEPE